ncbi:unnamed protein product [Rangifer tarandus platyrhynchus]|uniref:Uncharacterized protein n=2 Tax=Rangifer tarandus platyrhynchus TaxID=3082113 RepID=A0AC59ZSH5_RANTA|nr:unnamed protein product [Rangifer tarandus platyrhynchus]
MDRGGWRATVHGVTETDVTEQLSMHTCGLPTAQTASTVFVLYSGGQQLGPGWVAASPSPGCTWAVRSQPASFWREAALTQRFPWLQRATSGTLREARGCKPEARGLACSRRPS